jgi:hypothetical protein
MKARCLVGMGMLILAGCGGGYQVATVSGQVTMNGQPLAGAQVTFQPLGSGSEDPGPGSSGITDDQGRYTLKLLTSNKPGAVVGKHRVMIFTYRPSQSKAEGAVEPETIPPRFNLDSKVFFTVPPEGTQTADFLLVTP